MSDERDTDPMIPVVHDPAEVFAHESLRERVDDVNDANPWIRWSAIVVAVLMLAGAAIKWCNG